MPYAIQLSKLTNLPKPEEGEGYNLTIMLIDRDTSVIKKIRTVGLSTKFSEAFRTEASKDMADVLFAPTYRMHVREIQAAYPTWLLVAKSRVGYEFGDKEK